LEFNRGDFWYKLLGSPNFQLYGPLIKYTLLMAVSNAFKEVCVLHNGMSWAKAQLVQRLD